MARKRELAPLTEAQLEIMDIVWDRGEATVAAVWSVLGERREVSRNTVQTLMTRLADRGWLTSRADGNTFVFRATEPRGSAQRNLLRRLIDSAFQGSAEGLVMALLEDGVSPSEAARIRKLIEEKSP
ncbi:MAG: BlaI/MecI/CopY family transcriptional regulator [Pirellulaceae bacterium]|jgi:predicted transcriptional regulator|nr:BlaI/MecI/CopY family transcriptional regulator [Pirellulaceae bacterium]MDP7016348.1 BlaI/MecI/CopY family transcriptional regulator [Pirellulaceae bacterium]